MPFTQRTFNLVLLIFALKLCIFVKACVDCRKMLSTFKKKNNVINFTRVFHTFVVGWIAAQYLYIAFINKTKSNLTKFNKYL